MSRFDAIVVGAGPNGLAAAITLQRQGLSVLLVEEKETIGGGLRSAELTREGFIHDCCSSVYPFAVNSVFFDSIPWDDYGGAFIYPPAFLAHAFENGDALVLEQSIDASIEQLGADGARYKNIIGPLLQQWDVIKKTFLAPFHVSTDLFKTIPFSIKAIQAGLSFANRFHSDKTKALWAGVAAHSMLPLHKMATNAFALMLILAGHYKGWPVAKGGAQKIADILAAHFRSLGGTIETNRRIDSLQQLPPATAVLFDVTPAQLLKIAGDRFSPLYKRQLHHYKYGMAVYKIDWALSEPIPYLDKKCLRAATVHIGHSTGDIRRSEYDAWTGKTNEHPFVILTQPSLFDRRTTGNAHTAWAYCHVPNGYTGNRTTAIENQVEKIAPGFRDCILQRYVSGPAQLEKYNSNYIGGDINGGRQDISQLFTRPALRWSPYTTSAKGIYICSSSTPPGGGVHGLCGYFAAKAALKHQFGIRESGHGVHFL